jgi:hypothetical protein
MLLFLIKPLLMIRYFSPTLYIGKVDVKFIAIIFGKYYTNIKNTMK